MGRRIVLLALATSNVISRAAYVTNATYVRRGLTTMGYGSRYTCAEAKEHDEIIFDCGGEFISKARRQRTHARRPPQPLHTARCQRTHTRRPPQSHTAHVPRRVARRSPLRATARPPATATPTTSPTSERRGRATR